MNAVVAAGVALALAVPPLEPPPLAVSSPAIADATAVRIPTVDVGLPPVPPTFSTASANGRCVGAEPLLAFYSPGWSVERMSRIMYRESRCTPTAYNRRGRAAGLLQFVPITYRFLTESLGQVITSVGLFDPVLNVRAGAALWAHDGYRPWAT